MSTYDPHKINYRRLGKNHYEVGSVGEVRKSRSKKNPGWYSRRTDYQSGRDFKYGPYPTREEAARKLYAEIRKQNYQRELEERNFGDILGEPLLSISIYERSLYGDFRPLYQARISGDRQRYRSRGRSVLETLEGLLESLKADAKSQMDQAFDQNVKNLLEMSNPKPEDVD